MNESDIVKLLRQKIVPGMVLDNPRRGTSTIREITDTHIKYIRGSSMIYFPISEFIYVCNLFEGKQCSSSDLRALKPKVYDSKKSGHSCNCTFLFSIAKELGFTVEGICGSGTRGSPFYIVLDNF